MIKTIIIIILLIFSLFTGNAQTKIRVENIDIVRDSYGVPDIFSETDAEAVYGVAWAQCEDNFNLIQQMFAAKNGQAGKMMGKNGAAADFIYQSLGIAEFAKKRYPLDVDAHMNELLQAYADAINKYAETHPKEVISKKLFPFTPQDVAANYTFSLLMLHKSIIELGKVLSKNFNYSDLKPEEPRGSNTMAYSPNITTDAKTYLVGNPHQPIQGPASFWEVGVHSKEGIDIHGATFAGGGILPVIGANPNLGISLTNNYPNVSNVFKLEMHPSKKLTYKYDDEWLLLEEHKVHLKVKLGWIVLPVTKKFYISKYGTTYKKGSEFYGYKSNVFGNIKGAEFLYSVARAKNFGDFKQALNLQGLSSLNISYADKEGNIYLLSNCVYPYRDPAYNWCDVVPGNTSKTNWSLDSIHPISDHPQVFDPKCGYVYNTNNTEFKMTGSDENPKPEDFSESFCLRQSNNVRAKTFEKLISEYDKVSFDDVRKIRESVWFDKNNLGDRHCRNCGDIPNILAKYPELANANKVFTKWNGSFDVENEQAPVIAVSISYIMDYIMGNFLNEDQDVPEEIIKQSIIKAEKYLMKHYGKLEVKLGEIQRAVKDGVDLPMYGNMLTLANANFKANNKGKLIQVSGDSYIFYAKYGKDGLEELETVNAFGNSNKPGHPHATDQAELYTKMKTKRIELNPIKLREGKTSYHPQ